MDGGLMKIPTGMSEKETIEKINLVVNRISPKYTFKGYEVEDIKQEAFMICMDALDRYDTSRPLENFLSVHLSNRLKNFVRDNYFTKGDEEKKKVLSPKQLGHDDHIVDKHEQTDIKIDSKDVINLIDKFLPVEFRSDFLKFTNDVYVPKKRKLILIQVIKNILEENGYAKG